MATRDLLDQSSSLFYFGYLPSRILLALATISAAYSWRSLSEKILGGTDISYGIYIYHSIVINVFVELGRMNSMLSVVWIFLISATLAWLSWTLIEKPALSCKSLSPRLFFKRRATLS
jgi:peptidoglycan/LPS O-acetylase OafA/YrhL